MRIDFHSHFWLEEYFEFLDEYGEGYNTTYERDEQERVTFYQRGFDMGPISEAVLEPNSRMKKMDDAGLDMQALSFGGPGVDFMSIDHGVSMAKLVNDKLGELMRSHPGRFAGLATVSLKDVDAACEELRRAVREVGLHGVGVFSNCDGDSLADERYVPFFECVAELDVPVFIHPFNPRPNPMIGK